jgi:hypothetical protein
MPVIMAAAIAEAGDGATGTEFIAVAMLVIPTTEVTVTVAVMPATVDSMAAA